MLKYLQSRLPQPTFRFEPRVWAGDFQRGMGTLLTWPEVMLSLAMVFLDMVLLAASDFTLNTFSMVPTTIIIGYCFIAYAFYAGKTRVNSIRDKKNHAMAMQTLMGLGIFVLFNATADVLDYILTGSVVLPEWDSRLAAWDLAIGFHWLDWYHFVQSAPAFHETLRIVYELVSVEIVLLVLALPMSGHVRKGRWLLLWYIVTGLITIFIGLLMPAKGAFVFYHLPIAQHTGYVPVMADLRSGSLHTINLMKPQGLVVFPSFHAALAVICAAGAWAWKYLRYPFLILNLLIILSAPSQGGHYGVDVLAGIAIALATIYFVRPQRSTESAHV
ncbi:MAG: phosphatase PAP2 family protein [Acidithiobacillus sp.]|nr:phosphatase PAP2 family protein [Acidithiobacillus sp.]